MTNQEQERRERRRVYFAGRRAAQGGEGRGDCPYTGDLANHWRDGWDDETEGVEVSTW